MRTVEVFMTRDGKTFATEGDARRHAEECFSQKITDIANTLRNAFTTGDAAEGIGHIGFVIRDLEKLNGMFGEAVLWKRDRDITPNEED